MAGQVTTRAHRRTKSQAVREPIRYSVRLRNTWPWVPIALVQGMAFSWLTSIVLLSNTSSRALALICGAMLVQTLCTYALILGPARSWLRGDSVIKSGKWVLGPDSLAALTLPVLFATGIIFALSASGFTLGNTDLSVISMGAVVVAVAKGMGRLYKTEYLEVTNPEYKTERQDMGRVRRTLSFVFGVGRHQLQFPLLQAIIAVVLPSLLLIQLAVATLGMSYEWTTVLLSALVPVWGILWAEWNLRGGLVRLLHFGQGRPLNPALKPIKPLWKRFGRS